MHKRTRRVATCPPRRLCASWRPERLEPRRLLATFTVINTAASGAGSLAQAITSANSSAGADLIAFNIPGSGARVISTSELPAITGPVTLDGTTQPGYAGTPIVQVRRIQLTGGSSTVRGLSFGSNSGAGLEISGGGGNTVLNNWLGVRPDGTALASGFVRITGSDNNVIGANGASNRNVITGSVIIENDTGGDGSSGNIVRGNYIGTNPAGAAAIANTRAVGGFAVEVRSSDNQIGGTALGTLNQFPGDGNVIVGGVLIAADDVTMQGNLIGTNAAGTAALGTAAAGIRVSDGERILIGGTTPGARNVISGAASRGIEILEATGAAIGRVRIEGNYIGTNITGVLAIPNGVGTGPGAGIFVQNTITTGLAMVVSIGGTAAGSGNIIAFNDGPGVWVTGTGTRNVAVLGNSIFGNSGLGIDLSRSANEPDGETDNDVGTGVGGSDTDLGPNGLQNFPTIGSVSGAASGGIRVTASLRTLANRRFRVEFFSADVIEASNTAEGRTFLGFVNVTTDGNGQASIDTTFTAAAIPGDGAVLATATLLESDGTVVETSEFSPPKQVPFATLAGGLLMVSGTNGADALRVSRSGSQLVARLGSRTLGFSASSVTQVRITAFAGNDTVTLGQEVPTTFVDAGLGNDAVLADERFDAVLRATGAGGNDTLLGGRGADELSGANGRDRVLGAAGNDLLLGGAQQDVLIGGLGNDICSGGGGRDRVFGDLGSDYLLGGAADDYLDGDLLLSSGTDGTDTLSGNAGLDTARANSADFVVGIENLTRTT